MRRVWGRGRVITEDSILEGHFSHEFDNIDKIIVLRCDPKVLVKRLSERGYSKEKVRENLEAEAIGTIYSESDWCTGVS